MPFPETAPDQPQLATAKLWILETKVLRNDCGCLWLPGVWRERKAAP